MFDNRRWIWSGLAGAALCEIVACVGRFGAGVRSADVITPLTLGVRIHHGYVGAALLVLALVLPPKWRYASAAIGLALVVSDLIHHFVVLPLALGSFD